MSLYGSVLSVAMVPELVQEDNDADQENRLNFLPDDVLLEIAKYLRPEGKVAVCLAANERVRDAFVRSCDHRMLEVDLTRDGTLCKDIPDADLCAKMEMLATLLGQQRKITQLLIVFNSSSFSFDYFNDAAALAVRKCFRNIESLMLVDKTDLNDSSKIIPSTIARHCPFLPRLKYLRLTNIRVDKTVGHMLHSFRLSLKSVKLEHCPVDLSCLQRIPMNVRTLKIVNPSHYIGAEVAHWIDRSDVRWWVLSGPNPFLESVIRCINTRHYEMSTEYYLEYPVVDESTWFYVTINRNEVCRRCNSYDVVQIPPQNKSALETYYIQRAKCVFSMMFDDPDDPVEMNLDYAHEIFEAMVSQIEDRLDVLEAGFNDLPEPLAHGEELDQVLEQGVEDVPDQVANEVEQRDQDDTLVAPDETEQGCYRRFKSIGSRAILSVVAASAISVCFIGIRKLFKK